MQAPKPMQHPLHPVPAPHHTVPSLISSHGIFSLPGNSAATALLIQRTNEEEKWLARQRRLRQEKEDRQSQVSEFRQQVLEQHLDLGRPPVPTEVEHRPESTRWVLMGPHMRQVFLVQRLGRKRERGNLSVCTLPFLLLAHPVFFNFLYHSSPLHLCSCLGHRYPANISLSPSYSLSSMFKKDSNWKCPRCPALALHTLYNWREATLSLVLNSVLTVRFLLSTA